MGTAPARFDDEPRAAWSVLRDEWRAEWSEISKARGAPGPLGEWFGWVSKLTTVVVTDVVLQSAADVELLVELVLAPARRHGGLVVVVADAALEDLDEAAFTEEGFGFPYSLERLRWLAASGRLMSGPRASFAPPVQALDAEQQAAVDAPDGVTQIIAPAGSGKSTVLVQRVLELRRRGTPANRILALTFNKDAAADLARRLADVGAGDVHARTFHSFGLQVIRDAGLVTRSTKFDPLSAQQLRRLSSLAKKHVGEAGVWLDPGDASARISEIKLRRRLLPDEFRASLPDDADGEQLTIAAFYELYEETLAELGRRDFDDMVFRAVRTLVDDPELRAAWQGRVDRVLVDEYQDIEPTQELLVRIIAAPQDDLFCVGDDDQTLYAFRRASVARILDFNEHYPSRHLVMLRTNYRCPGRIVAPSAELVGCNRVRFPKTIEAAADSRELGEVALMPVDRVNDAAAQIAASLTDAARGDVAILARVTSALRPIALAAAELGIKLAGPAQLFDVVGARRAVMAHLELLEQPREATADLVLEIGRTPARGINATAARTIAERLQDGASFEDAFVGAGRTPAKQLDAGALFTRLAELEDASDVVAALRDIGAIDRWYERADQYQSEQDSLELEELEALTVEARGVTAAVLLRRLRRQTEALAAVRDLEHGIELATIHRSKGREWPRVVLFACDEGTLPSALAMKASADEIRRGEGLEAERRLAYVAFTRAGARLEIFHDIRRPSRFLEEAGLRRRAPSKASSPAPRPRRARTTPTAVPPPHDPAKTIGPPASLEASPTPTPAETSPPEYEWLPGHLQQPSRRPPLPSAKPQPPARERWWRRRGKG